MSKERALRRQRRLKEQAIARQIQERQRMRRLKRRQWLGRLALPVRSAMKVARTAWQPIAGGQTGRLAKRRRQRFLVMTIVACAVNLAIALLWSDLGISVATAGLTVVVVPVLARLLFSRR